MNAGSNDNSNIDVNSVDMDVEMNAILAQIAPENLRGTDARPNPNDGQDIETPGTVTNEILLKVMLGKFNGVERKLTQMTAKCGQLEQKLLVTEQHVTTLTQENQMLKYENNELKIEMHDVQNLVRAKNLIIGSLAAEKSDESPDDCEAVVRKFLSSCLKLDGEMVDISTAVRMKNAQSAIKPILVKLVHESDKYKILVAAREKLGNINRQQQPQTPWVKPDRSKKVRVIRGKLSRFFMEKKRDGHEVKMIDDHLMINGVKWNYIAANDDIEQAKSVNNTR